MMEDLPELLCCANVSQMDLAEFEVGRILSSLLPSWPSDAYVSQPWLSAWLLQQSWQSGPATLPRHIAAAMQVAPTTARVLESIHS